VATPKVSVIIPTYNRRELLRRSLFHLTRQRLPAGEFEVIVADDGSSDDTKEMVESYRDRLTIKYCYQADLGYRVSAARNAGARLAEAPILAFLDSGVQVGPDWLTRHLAAHLARTEPIAVTGYAFGYNPPDPMPGIGEALAEMLPEEVVERFRDDPAFLDIRHEQMALCGFEMDRRLLPWTLFWPINCSLRAVDFHAVGGFDEDYVVWGLEDMEFGLRLWQRGVSFEISRDAWAVESPHERDEARNWEWMQRNIRIFLARHPEPVVEIGWGLLSAGLIWEWEDEYRRLLDWTGRAGDRDVTAEVVAAVSDVPAGHRIAVIGCGDLRPEAVPGSVLIDFDRALLPEGGLHAIGLRTALPDESVDTVVLTSRLAGLWQRWSPQLIAEARRLGHDVRVTGELGETA
jgi:glycosyltransferase involved in cell wall biosynthesis